MQLRAQANVLKKAVVEEQTKGGQSKEAIRLKEVELRRSEQEVDSLTFRNKQLELRVATLQNALEEKQQQQQGKQKWGVLQKAAPSNGTPSHMTILSSSNNTSSTAANKQSDANVVAEEFQKKIIENAQLISLLADKSHELEMCQGNLQQLEEKVNAQMFTQSFVEEGLRHEIQELCVKNATLEMKLLERGGADEDSRSVTTENSSILADTAPLSSATEDRILSLEKELTALRSKYELLQLQEKTRGAEGEQQQQPTAGGEAGAAEEMLYEHFSKTIDEILLERQLAESKLVSYLAECDSLRNQLEILTDELRDQERQLGESQRTVKRVEDHLQTTRLNYEEQISVLTEQVLSLSDQLAAASN